MEPLANKALDATTTGTGELIDHALDAGARRIIVGLGGSATTDGGFGAIRAITAIARLKQVELLVACDVSTPLRRCRCSVRVPKKEPRSRRSNYSNGVSADWYRCSTRTSPLMSPTSKAVGRRGGLGGALAALGGRLVPGFELVADELDLFDHLDVDNPHRVDVIITGEGRLDSTSFDGKVVGGIVELGRDAGIPVVAVVGDADADVTGQSTGLRATAVLADLFGLESALAEPKQNIERATAALIRAHLD